MTGASPQSEANAGSKTVVHLPTKVIPTFMIDAARLPWLYVIFRAAVPQRDEEAARILRAIFASDPANKGKVPPASWVLGQTDYHGVLSAPEAFFASPTDSYKLTRKGKYEFVFVNHPDLEIAKTLTKDLNELFEQQKVKVHVLEVGEDGKVEVPLDPAGFTPKGPKQYGGYCLFHDMPLQDVPSIRKEVTKLQADLGKLRWIVGGKELDTKPAPPYEPCSLEKKLGGESAAEPIIGDFSKQTLNGVYGFQDACRRKSLWQLEAAPTDSWSYLAVKNTGGVPSRFGVDATPAKADGVVDEVTGDALADAVAKHLRRSGDILVEVEAHSAGKPGARVANYNKWLRTDAAQAFYAWSEAVTALGSDTGVSFNWSFRSVFDAMNPGGPDPGKAVKSQHKTGLAVDLVTGGAMFPIVKVHEEVNHWRLYVPSHVALPSEEDLALAAERIEAALRASLAKPRSAKLEKFPAVAQKLLTALETPDTFFATYFKAEVAPWIYQANVEGGYAEPMTKPPFGESWLDVTAVADAAGMKRISAVEGWRGKRYKQGIVPSVDVVKDRTCSSLWIARQNELDGEANRDKARAEHPDEVVAEKAARRVKIKRDGKHPGEGPDDFPLASVQLQTLRDWIVATDKKLSVGISVAHPCLTLILSAKSKPQSLSEVKSILDDAKFAAAPFWGSFDGEQEVLSGADWSTKISRLHEELLPPSEKTDGSQGTAAPRTGSYTVLLTPLFSTEGDGSTLGPADTASVRVDYAGGISRCQEFWHFQTAEAEEANWYSNMVRLGWKEECLRAPYVAAFYRTGIGYEPSRAEIAAANAAAEQRAKDAKLAANKADVGKNVKKV